MSACGPRCGYCGRCTYADEEPEARAEYRPCDRCNGDAFYAVTTPLGTYCSHKCESADAAEFTERMRRRGHQDLSQPFLARASGDR